MSLLKTDITLVSYLRSNKTPRRCRPVPSLHLHRLSKVLPKEIKKSSHPSHSALYFKSGLYGNLLAESSSWIVLLWIKLMYSSLVLIPFRDRATSRPYLDTSNGFQKTRTISTVLLWTIQNPLTSSKDNVIPKKSSHPRHSSAHTLSASLGSRYDPGHEYSRNSSFESKQCPRAIFRASWKV